jgi:hypothetical protein
VVDQRSKISRETKGRLKLFNNSKLNSILEEEPQPSNGQFVVKTKPTSSHKYR